MPPDRELSQLEKVLRKVTGSGQSAARKSTWLTEATRDFVVTAAGRGNAVGGFGLELSHDRKRRAKRRETALKVLAVLATETANAEPMWNHPATREALVHCSALAAPADRKCREHALGALVELTYETDTHSNPQILVSMWNDLTARKALVYSSALGAPADRKCRESALRVLSNLACADANKELMWNDPATREALVHCSGTANRKCREHALGALINLTYENDITKVSIWNDLAAREALVSSSVLGAPADRNCRESALRVLSNLAHAAANSELMWKDDAAREALVHCSALGAPADRTCRAQALQCLANLACADGVAGPMWTHPATRQALVESSALAEPADRVCREYALKVLANFAFSEATRLEMWQHLTTRQVLVDESTLAEPADRKCREQALLALAKLVEDPQVVADVRANVPAVRAAAEEAVALATAADAEVRKQGQFVLDALDGDDLHGDTEEEDEGEEDDEEEEVNIAGPLGPNSAAAAAETTNGSSTSERSAGGNTSLQTTRGGSACFKPLPTVPTVSLKTSAQARANLLADWLATATAVVDDNTKASNAEIAEMESALDATVVKATAAHGGRVDKATSDHAASVAKADAERMARTASSLRQLESTKSAARAQHAVGLQSRERMTRRQGAELAEIEAAYKETVATIAAAGTAANSDRKRKTAAETTPPPAKRGKGAATTPPDSAAAAAAESVAVAERERPAFHMCPLTHVTMVDPVMTVDGQTYERGAIETWFEKHATSPMTNMELSSTALFPNIFAKQSILDWVP